MAATGSILIGDRAFWRSGNGAAHRQREILSFLGERGPVDLVYCGPKAGEFQRLAARLAAAAATREIRCEALPPSLDPRRAAARFATLAAERPPRRVVVFSPELTWVADLVPGGVPVVLDAAGPPAEAEARLLDAARACDLALFDDRRRLAAAAAVLGAERCAWSPSSVAVADPLPPLRGRVARVGVSFGTGAVDAEALAWFHDEVWRSPELASARATVEVVVGGDPGDGGAARACPEFRFVGPVDRPSPFFVAVDVVAALRTGAAQPSFEAFGFARPLVAPPAAVTAMPEAADACLVAESAADFAAALASLIDDAALRRRCVDAGLAVARRLLSPEACFRPILEAAPGMRPPPAPLAAARAAPPSLEERFAQGLAHRRAGRFALAERAFRGILAVAPDHPEALQALGGLLARAGNPAEALPLLRHVVARRPESSRLWNALAAVLNALARHAEAEDAASRALALRPACLTARVARARALRGLGRAAEAEAECAAALQTRAAPELLHERGLARWDLGDPEAAEADLRAAAAARPAEPAWAADLARLTQWRQAAGAPPPRVALACGGGLTAQWEPVWGLPGVAVAAVAPGAEPPADSDLLITTDADLAARWAAAGRPVWLCGEGGRESARIKVFPEHGGRGWAIAEISAHLAVWARAWRATNATTKPIAAAGPEGYIPR